MAKNTETTETKKSYTAKQVFFALLPWTIILTLLVGFIGVVTGWNMRSQYHMAVQNEAKSQVAHVSELKN